MDSQGYGRLRRKIMTVTLFFSLVPLFALGFFIHHQFTKTYHEKILRNLERAVDNRRRAVDIFLEERVAQLKSLAYTHSYEQLSSPAQLNAIFNIVQANSKSYVDMGVIDAEGDHVAYVGPFQLGRVNYKDEAWFHETMLKGQYVSDVFMGFRKFPHFIIAVMRREGNRSWILRATIDSDVFNSLVKGVHVGELGDAYLVNAEGVLQTDSRFAGPAMSKLTLTLPTQPRAGAPAGPLVEERLIRDRTMIVGMAWQERVPWLLVIMEDPKEELMALLRTQSIVAVLVGGGILLIICGTVLITRSIINKLIEADREKATLDASLMQSSKMAALGKLAAGVAHEVNNPLTLIRESAGWIKDLLIDEDPERMIHLEEVETAANKIEMHVDRAKAVTHRMLGFGRRMEPVQENVSLNMLTDQTVKFLESEALHRNIEIIKRLDENLPNTTTDTAQIQQVILNILDNAIDAVGAGGTITVSTGRSSDGRDIYVSVADTGTGISKDKLNKIFDPFFTTKKVGEGTGLGLAICYGILEKLGGRIEVQSEEGKGSTFTVFLPVV
ncbi:MAG TPA: two-component sensor histidine kinase [Desulfovibrio sp.]|jgi:two-component system NtrC family sensor kinase|nr:two-component sensor histidine kinase [Desulfovibrio sp.]HBR06109.1 two-component sensor histidine kinase [Desulfovibrio sp.]